jgi:protein involved in polysaccharide export with SLBB domain
VRVRDDHSQVVGVRGAVNRPGPKPLRHGTRLVDALLDAGGFVQGASGEVVVLRAAGFEGGGREAHFKFGGGDPSADELQKLGLPLTAGDRVTAVLQRWVGVSGAVERPGQYAFEESLTLSMLVGLAKPLRSGSDRVILRRAGVDQEVDSGTCATAAPGHSAPSPATR